jgi:hypothetical protein
MGYQEYSPASSFLKQESNIGPENRNISCETN